MNVLVFNCGSSSLKYKLIAMPSEEEIAGGEAQRVGPKTSEPSRIVHRLRGKEEIRVVEMPNHPTAFEEVMKLLARNPELTPDAVGHRVVHGGAVFGGHARVDADVIRQLEAIQGLAPIHNPPATLLVKACFERYPRLPQVLVFDTAYHATIPEYARTYALPENLRRELGIRKYGFHGTSHHYVVSEAAKLLGKPMESFSGVSCHLGSGGASLCAVVNGKSIDNTMGYSPLQGLIMSTRCGDLDPAVTLDLLAHYRGDHNAVSRVLNQKSGVLGMSGISADIRDILKMSGAGKDSPQAAATLQIYLWRIRKYLGAYLAAVGRADAVIFTDTIGESIPDVRERVCADMGFFGVRLDSKRNRAALRLPADVAADDSAVRILVIATNEELAIARNAFRFVANAA